MRRIVVLLVGLLLLGANRGWAQPFVGPEQKGFPFVRLSKVAATAGFVNSPTVLQSGGNATTTLGTPGTPCTVAGCTDVEKVANASNAGTLIMTTQPSATLTTGQYVFIDVNDSGTAPSDVYFVAGTGVTLKSLQVGLTSANLTGTTAVDKLARQNACGVPPATGDVIYNAIWLSPNLYVTGCSSREPGTVISPALIGGAQWASRTVNGPGSDTVLASDTLIADNTTPGPITENLPACNTTNVGKSYIFKKTDATNGSITLTPNGADTIDGAANVVISAPSVEYPIQCSLAGGVWFRELPIPYTHQFGGTDVSGVGSNGQLLTSNGINFVVASRPVRPGFEFGNCASNACNSVSHQYALAEQWTFPAGLSGSYPDATTTIAKCTTNPSESDQYSVTCDSALGAACGGTALGTVTISTSCVATLAGAGGGCAAGNTLRVCAPATASGVGIEITLAGHTP